MPRPRPHTANTAMPVLEAFNDTLTVDMEPPKAVIYPPPCKPYHLTAALVIGAACIALSSLGLVPEGYAALLVLATQLYAVVVACLHLQRGVQPFHSTAVSLAACVHRVCTAATGVAVLGLLVGHGDDEMLGSVAHHACGALQTVARLAVVLYLFEQQRVLPLLDRPAAPTAGEGRAAGALRKVARRMRPLQGLAGLAVAGAVGCCSFMAFSAVEWEGGAPDPPGVWRVSLWGSASLLNALLALLLLRRGWRAHALPPSLPRSVSLRLAGHALAFVLVVWCWDFFGFAHVPPSCVLWLTHASWRMACEVLAMQYAADLAAPLGLDTSTFVAFDSWEIVGFCKDHQRLFRCQPGASGAVSFRDMVVPCDRQWLDAVSCRKAAHHLVLRLHPPGSADVVTVLARVAPLGHNVGAVALEDITEYAHAGELPLQGYRDAMCALPEPVMVVNQDLAISFANTAMLSLLGHPGSEHAMGIPVDAVLVDADLDTLAAASMGAKAGAGSGLRSKVKCSDGTHTDVSMATSELIVGPHTSYAVVLNTAWDAGVAFTQPMIDEFNDKIRNPLTGIDGLLQCIEGMGRQLPDARPGPAEPASPSSSAHPAAGRASVEKIAREARQTACDARRLVTVACHNLSALLRTGHSPPVPVLQVRDINVSQSHSMVGSAHGRASSARIGGKSSSSMAHSGVSIPRTPSVSARSARSTGSAFTFRSGDGSETPRSAAKLKEVVQSPFVPAETDPWDSAGSVDPGPTLGIIPSSISLPFSLSKRLKGQATSMTQTAATPTPLGKESAPKGSDSLGEPIRKTLGPFWEVLLVDDSPLNLKVMTNKLKGQGPFKELAWNVSTASNAEEAIHMFMANKNFDLVMMDKNLEAGGGQMDGWDTTIVIRALERHLDLPRCFIMGATSHCEMSDVRQAAIVGQDNVCGKPYPSAMELYRMLELHAAADEEANILFCENERSKRKDSLTRQPSHCESERSKRKDSLTRQPSHCESERSKRGDGLAGQGSHS